MCNNRSVLHLLEPTFWTPATADMESELLASILRQHLAALQITPCITRMSADSRTLVAI